MKTFLDLEFVTHPNSFMGGFIEQAKLTFDNGFGVSVITGGYGNSENPYEVAVLDKAGTISYDTGITEDVIGHLDPNGVTEIMSRVQNLIAV